MDKYRAARLKIIDELLRSGKPVSYRDCRDEIANRFKLYKELLNDVNYHLKDQYNQDFRQDILLMRSIINDLGIDGNKMLKSSGRDGTKTTYTYDDPSFSIIPYLGTKLNKRDYNAIEKLFKGLKKNLPPDVYEQLEFVVKDHLEYEFGPKDKTYDDYYKDRIDKWLELLKECINKKVVTVLYETFNDNKDNFILHPHSLEQHNNRWFLHGYRPDRSVYNYRVALDRIIDLAINENIPFEYKPVYYTNMIHFKDLYFIAYSTQDAPSGKKTKLLLWPEDEKE